MKRRWIIFVVFLAAVGISGYLRQPQSAAPEAAWKATVMLEKNTRISRIHLKKPDLPTPASAWNLPEPAILEGKYAIHQIKKDARVTADQLSATPNIPEVKDTALFFYNTQDLGSAQEQLNTGATLYVCDIEKSCDPTPYPIEAVLGKEKPYTVVLRVPKPKVDDLRKLTKVQLRLASLP